jgi:hypothetical protein
MKEYLVHFVGVVKEELDGRNSPWRIREIPRAVRSCRGAGKLRQVFFKCKLRRNWTVGSKSTRVVGSLVNSHFGDSRVEGPKTLHQDSRNREVRSPDRARSSVVGPALITISVRIHLISGKGRHFGG